MQEPTEGEVILQQTQSNYTNSTLHTANFQVYNEPIADPSICEVYAVIGREVENLLI